MKESHISPILSLSDFISIVKDRTYAIFRIQNDDDETNQNSKKTFFLSIVAGHQ